MAKKVVKVANDATKIDLGYLGIDFQHKLVKLFFEDSTFFTMINPIVDQNMFTEDVLRRIVGFMKDRYNESGVAPTYVDMDLYIRVHVHDAITLDTILSTLQVLREIDLVGQDIVKSEADKFFKQQNLTKAINKSIEIVKEGNVSKYYDIEDLIRGALDTNVSLDMGYNPMDGIDEALEENYRKVIPTGFSRLDKALYGGLGTGELGVIIAPSGVGKSSATTGFAASAATYKCKDNDYRGFKVLHIHFEDEDVNIKRKYYGWLTGVDAIDLSRPEFKEDVKSRLKNELFEEAQMIKENLWCFHLPSGEVTVGRIEQIVKQGIARGFKPDLIIIDYFECLEYDSADKTDSEWSKEGRTMRKLEALAHKYEAGLWVPIQGTKDSFDKEILGLSSGGGSVKKIQIGHVIITLARTQEQKKNHRVTISLEKFRAGRMDDSVMPNVKFNNGTCRFEIDEEEDQALDFIAQQEDIQLQRTRENVANSVMKNRKNR
jgi:dnaB-like helicase C terminal domain|nr:MAG TPA: DnaB-like replicative helicase [Herelleviridae sp.]DAP93764.1 MAG TPA: DnaB-like replicative helicase [Bacteriophage sp.]